MTSYLNGYSALYRLNNLGGLNQETILEAHEAHPFSNNNYYSSKAIFTKNNYEDYLGINEKVIFTNSYSQSLEEPKISSPKISFYNRNISSTNSLATLPPSSSPSTIEPLEESSETANNRPINIYLPTNNFIMGQNAITGKNSYAYQMDEYDNSNINIYDNTDVQRYLLYGENNIINFLNSTGSNMIDLTKLKNTNIIINNQNLDEASISDQLVINVDPKKSKFGANFDFFEKKLSNGYEIKFTDPNGNKITIYTGTDEKYELNAAWFKSRLYNNENSPFSNIPPIPYKESYILKETNITEEKTGLYYRQKSDIQPDFPGSSVQENAPLLDQTENACGTTALAMALKMHGINVTPQQLDNKIRENEGSGVSTLAFRNEARRRGVNAEAYNNMTFDQIKKFIDDGDGVSVLMDANIIEGAAKGEKRERDTSGRSLHWTNITGYNIDEKGQRFIRINDPNNKIYWLKYEQFVDTSWSNIKMLGVATGENNVAVVTSKNSLPKGNFSGEAKAFSRLSNGALQINNAFADFGTGELWQGVMNLVGGVYNIVVGGVVTLVHKVGNLIQNLGTSLVNMAGNFLSNIWDFMSNSWSWFTGIFSGKKEVNEQGDSNNNHFIIDEKKVEGSIDGNDGNDLFEIKNKKNDIKISGGNGNDIIRLEGKKNTLKAYGDSGDDVFIYDGDKENEIYFHGGSGFDVIKLNGGIDDWRLEKASNAMYKLVNKKKDNVSILLQGVEEIVYSNGHVYKLG